MKAWASERAAARPTPPWAWTSRTLRPLYALKLGEPGASHALGIAEGLGLDPRGGRGGPPGRPARAAGPGGAARPRRPARAPRPTAEREAARGARRPREAAEGRAAERAGASLERRIARARARAPRPSGPPPGRGPRPSWRASRASSPTCAARSRRHAARRPAGRAARPRRRRGERARAARPPPRRRLAAAAAGARGAARAAPRRVRARRRPSPSAVGDHVIDPAMGFRGRILSIDGGRAEVQGGLGADARAAGAAGAATARPRAAPSSARSRRPRRRRPQGPPASFEIDVRGRRAEETRGTVRERIDAAGDRRASTEVRVIHGHGTGALRAWCARSWRGTRWWRAPSRPRPIRAGTARRSPTSPTEPVSRAQQGSGSSPMPFRTPTVGGHRPERLVLLEHADGRDRRLLHAREHRGGVTRARDGLVSRRPGWRRSRPPWPASSGFGQVGSIDRRPPSRFSFNFSTAASEPGKRTFPSLLRTSSVGTVTNSSFGMAREITDSRRPLAGGPARRVSTGRAGPKHRSQRSPRTRIVGVDCSRRRVPCATRPAVTHDQTMRPQGGTDVRKRSRYSRQDLSPDRRGPSQHPLLRPGQEGRGLEDPDHPPVRPSARPARATSTRPRRSSSSAATSDLWDEIEECVSGFNVQIINQSSHLIFWLTNLNAWYGRANDGLSTLVAVGRAHQVPRLELRVHDDADRPAPHELPDRAHGEPPAVRDGPGRRRRHARRVGPRHRQHPHRLRPQAGRRREGLRPHAEPASSPGRTPSATRSRTPRPAVSARASSSTSSSTRAPTARRSRPTRPWTRPSRPKGMLQEQAPIARPHRGDRRPRRQVQP